MLQLQASAVRQQPPRKVYIHKDLQTSTHIFVHHDAVRKPLQPPYNGSYCVLKRADKHYTIEIGNLQEVVSLDCLKLAYMESDHSTDIGNDTPTQATNQSTKFLVMVTRSQGRCHRYGWYGHLVRPWPYHFLPEKMVDNINKR